MPKQDWSPRLEKVWVVGFDTEDGFAVEVYETDEAAWRAAAEQAHVTLKAENEGIEGTEDLLSEAQQLWDRGRWKDLVGLQADQVSEGNSSLGILVFEEKIRKS